MKTSTFLFTILLPAFSSPAFAQAGNLDSTFGNNGTVTADFYLSDDNPRAVTVQPDGKIVAAGFLVSGVNAADFALVRFNADGTLDNSFGINGKVITDLGLLDEAFSVAIQADGKVVAAGNTGGNFGMVRYNSDGSLDNSFGTGGKVNTEIDPGNDVVYSLAIQLNGKILAAGSASNGGYINDFALVRYNTDGTLDSSFSTDGIATTDFVGNSAWNYDGASSVAIQSDGNIVVAGTSIIGNVGYFSLARYHIDGTLDSSFSDDGKITTNFSSGGDGANSLLIQPDGKIVAGGVFSGNEADFALVRYNTNGTLDSSFGTDGKVLTDFDYGFDEAESMVLQPDGKIVVTGETNFALALARYNSNGSLDNSFGMNGKVTTVFPAGFDLRNRVAIGPDLKIVALSEAAFNGTGADFVVFRFLSGLEVGIADFSSLQSSPLIYPNPIQEKEVFKYTLTKDEVLSLRLYDVNGRVIQTFFTNESRTVGEHHEQLTFGNLAAGNYLLTLSNGTQQVSVKIMKQ